MRIDLASGTTAELALPSGDSTPTLGAVVHPDIAGLRPLFDDLCARLAADHGWAVCAPEPFPGRESMTLEERMAAMAGLDDHTQLAHLLAAADVLVDRGAPRVVVLGFCMGGMYVYKAAGTGRFDRGVSFYGMARVPEPWQGSGQGDPLQALLQPGACPVLAVVGGRDPYTPPEDVASLQAIPHVEVVEYPEAEHGFVHDPSRPAHRPDDAADAWRRAVAFLQAGE